MPSALNNPHAALETRAWHLKQLRVSLRALAASDTRQPGLFPDAAQSPDELALAFDHWSAVVRDHYGDQLLPDQSAALAAVDERLRTMSRDGAEFDAELWTEAALAASDIWASVRALALAALEAFGWTGENA